MIKISKDSELDVAFRVYGDNILECENFVDWLLKENVSKFKFESEQGTIDRPILIFKDTLSSRTIAFQLCPYFGGPGTSIFWQHNPLQGIFDEKIDVVVTRVREDQTESAPVFAVEFVDALMAGNQGWQRFRRAVNAAVAGVSYMYVQPIIGWERDSNGLRLKNPRFLPAQTCLAQLTLCSKFGVPSLQIYRESSWSEYASQKGYVLPPNYATFGGIDNAIRFACSLIRSSVEKSSQSKDLLKSVLKTIIAEMIEVARTYTKFSNSCLPIHHNHPALQSNSEAAEEYAEAMVEHHPVVGRNALHEIDADDFQFGSLFFKDAQEGTCSANFQNNVLSLLNWKSSKDVRYKVRYLSTWGIPARSDCPPDELDRLAEANKRNLPLTYKMNKSEGCLISNRQVLRSIIAEAYPRLSTEVLNWICPTGGRSELPPIFLIPLYGYKPSGDSRPDRGLTPLLWAMFPSLLKKETTLVIVYSKHTPPDWRPIVEGGGNELWNSITGIAGAIIVDKTGDGMLLQSHSSVQARIDNYDRC